MLVCEMYNSERSIVKYIIQKDPNLSSKNLIIILNALILFTHGDSLIWRYLQTFRKEIEHNNNDDDDYDSNNNNKVMYESHTYTNIKICKKDKMVFH